MHGETIAPDPRMLAWLQRLAPRSRQRAMRARLSHDLPPDIGVELFQRQRGRCAVSGLPFSLRRVDGILVKHPFAPSLDRISSRGGYTTDNVRLVCVAVNFGMGQWGEELYLTFARAAVTRSERLARDGVRRAGTPTVPDSDTVEPAWHSQQLERIAAAEAIAATLSGDELLQQRRRIASLKRNLTLGPAGLRAAAAKAVRTRS